MHEQPPADRPCMSKSSQHLQGAPPDLRRRRKYTDSDPRSVQGHGGLHDFHLVAALPGGRRPRQRNGWRLAQEARRPGPRDLADSHRDLPLPIREKRDHQQRLR